jgi:RimJ/RimL family protein N-acetyltransferase
MSLLNDARSLWTALAGTPVAFSSGSLTVVVSPNSLICPPSWVGVVVLGDAAIATAPEERSADRLRRAWTDIDHVKQAMTWVNALGPASLAYLDPVEFRPTELAAGTGGNLSTLFAAVDSVDLNESGVDEITSPAFTVTEGDRVVAAAGYRTWLGRAAHISVLVAPDHRGRGLATAVASAAVTDAIHNGLLPQWRARIEYSRRVARTLGFRELGAQLSLKLADGH